MEDLFEREQAILDQALTRAADNAPCSAEEYTALVNEYSKLLKQLRRVTKISDRTTIDLNARKQDLMDKVNYDELTGIYNRRFLRENASLTLQSLAGRGAVMSVLMTDIDFFKQYNDTYGHSQGDTCLCAVAQTLNRCTLRQEDYTVRYGGEEFVTVLPGTCGQGARIIGERILESVRSCRIRHIQNQVSDVVTVSVGITTGQVEGFHTIEDFIRVADKALYLSKQNGRNRSTFVKLEEGL